MRVCLEQAKDQVELKLPKISGLRAFGPTSEFVLRANASMVGLITLLLLALQHIGRGLGAAAWFRIEREA